MKKFNDSSFNTIGWASQLYLLFVFLMPILGWVLILFILYNFERLLHEKYNNNSCDKQISYLFNGVLLQLIATPIIRVFAKTISANLAMLVGSLLVVGIGVLFALLGFKLSKASLDLFKLKGQLVGSLFIAGTSYFIFGVSLGLLILPNNKIITTFSDTFSMVSYGAFTLLCLVFGMIFLKVEKSTNIAK